MYNLCISPSLKGSRHVTEGLTLKSRTIWSLPAHSTHASSDETHSQLRKWYLPFLAKILTMSRWRNLVLYTIDAVLGSRIEGECEGHVEKTKD